MPGVVGQSVSRSLEICCREDYAKVSQEGEGRSQEGEGGSQEGGQNYPASFGVREEGGRRGK